MKLRQNKGYFKAGVTALAVSIISLTFYFLVEKLDQVSGAWHTVTAIVRPFIVGGALAYLLAPGCNGLERIFLKVTRGRGEKRVRGLAIAITLLLTVAIVAMLVYILVPQVIQSLVTVVNRLPGQINHLRQDIDKLLENEPELRSWWDRIFTQITGAITSWRETGLMPTVTAVLSGTASYVTGFAVAVKDVLLGLIVTIYLLAARRRFAAQSTLLLKGVCPEKWLPKVEEEIHFIDHMFHEFMLGKLLDSAIVGVLCFIGCLVLGLPSAPLISVVIGLTNIIPFVGPFIGAVPCAIILLLEDPVYCLIFVIFILILQQLDGNVLGPRIIGNTTGMSGFWITFAILFFGGLWGLVGMLVAVPLFAVIYDIVRKVLFSRLKRKGHGELITEYEKAYHQPQQAKKRKWLPGRKKPPEEPAEGATKAAAESDAAGGTAADAGKDSAEAGGPDGHGGEDTAEMNPEKTEGALCPAEKDDILPEKTEESGDDAE